MCYRGLRYRQARGDEELRTAEMHKDIFILSIHKAKFSPLNVLGTVANDGEFVPPHLAVTLKRNMGPETCLVIWG